MKKTYYLFNSGRISRKDNTLRFTPVDENGEPQSPKYIPVEGVSDIYAFGALDVNSALLNFFGQQQIAIHFFDYYENYTGSFMPREYLLAGKVQIQQTAHYLNRKKRMALAARLVDGASFNILKNLRYYHNRDKAIGEQIETIEALRTEIARAASVEQLMGIEGNIRQVYYSAFDTILNEMEMPGRSKQPPQNPVNALISFGNMICYTECLRAIHHTQLNPTISFLHEPGMRRYSLALDIAEIFKPILVDRVIFKLVNKREIRDSDFEAKLNRCLMKESGKKTFLRAWEQRLAETIKHRTLKRQVSYKHLIRLECYKLAKHILDIQPYQPLKMWW
jgi:CRISPR-associated protein Cas1